MTERLQTYMVDKPADFEQALDAVLSAIRETLLKKHHDYGEANLHEFGLLGILIRANDKLSRLKTLQRCNAQVDETIADTWLDLAGYAVQALIFMRK